MGANDWIHTIRGRALVEGTLPALVRAVKNLNNNLKEGNMPHPYVGLTGHFIFEPTIKGTVVSVEDGHVLLLTDNGGHIEGKTAAFVLDDPKEGRRRLSRQPTG